MRYSVLLVLIGLFLFMSSGCVIRVYEKEMPRKDILVEGNQGYLVGSPETSLYVPEKKTRKILVTEIELINPKEIRIESGKEETASTQSDIDRKTESDSIKIKEDSAKEANYGYIYKKEEGAKEDTKVSEATSEESSSGEAETASGTIEGEAKDAGTMDNSGDVAYTIYKVEKGDTLQKISYKFYGKYSLWPKIFEANKDRLENPDSLYVGQELRIPKLEK